MKILNKNKLLIVLLMVFLPLSVFADTSCAINLGKGQNNTLKVGDILSLNLGFDEISADKKISSLDYSLSFDKNVFEIVNDNGHYIKIIDGFKIDKEDLNTSSNNALFNFKVTANSENDYLLNNNSNKNAVAILKLKVKNGNVSQSNIIINNESSYVENNENKNCSRSTVMVYIKSNANALSSIKIDNKELSNFNENNTIYDLNVNGSVESINIEAIKKDSKSEVSGDIGNKSLKYGINNFKIIVTSESGDKKVYELNVTRVDERSHINTLKTLKISSGSINFKPDVNDYDITVKNDVEKITITSELTDNKAKYKEDYRNKTIELNEGMNKITITVIAEDNKENTYNINITRELSSNNTLSKLLINNKEIKLIKDTFLYNYEVENDVTKANIEAIPSNSKATIEIENTDLEVGDNEINIYVTAPNGDVVSYTLIVTRKQKLSSNSLVKSIIISGYSLNFKSDSMYYTLKIKDEDTLDIKVTPEDDRSNVDIDGNKDLIDGSIIKITVKSEDNTVTRYFITIEKGNKNSLSWLIILLIVLIIIAVIIIFLIRKKEKKLMANKEEEKVEYKEPEYSLNDEEDKEEEKADTDNEEGQDNPDSDEKKEPKTNPIKRNVLVDSSEEE